MGAGIALTLGTPWPEAVRRGGRILLQSSVVLLGFSVEFESVVRAGSRGILYSALMIGGTFAIGALVARWLKVKPEAALLVAGGTAICGGSAIAALASVTDADPEDVGVAAGTVFLLNAVALLLFPPLGHLMNLSEAAFGTWAGLGIHDVASVVGAGTAYGPVALATATTVKLSRVLFLVPVTLIVAWRVRRPGGRIAWPWFIAGFLAASLLRGILPPSEVLIGGVQRVSSAGFALALLAIGLGFSREALARVSARPLLLGVLLWILVAAAGLILARTGTV